MNKIIDVDGLLKDAQDFIQAIWPQEAIPSEVGTAFLAVAAGGFLILLVYILTLWGK